MQVFKHEPYANFIAIFLNESVAKGISTTP
jgi:hypothetical protein